MDKMRNPMAMARIRMELIAMDKILTGLTQTAMDKTRILIAMVMTMVQRLMDNRRRMGKMVDLTVIARASMGKMVAPKPIPRIHIAKTRTNRVMNRLMTLMALRVAFKMIIIKMRILIVRTVDLRAMEKALLTLMTLMVDTIMAKTHTAMNSHRATVKVEIMDKVILHTMTKDLKHTDKILTGLMLHMALKERVMVTDRAKMVMALMMALKVTGKILMALMESRIMTRMDMIMGIHKATARMEVMDKRMVMARTGINQAMTKGLAATHKEDPQDTMTTPIKDKGVRMMAARESLLAMLMIVGSRMQDPQAVTKREGNKPAVAEVTDR